MPKDDPERKESLGQNPTPTVSLITPTSASGLQRDRPGSPGSSYWGQGKGVRETGQVGQSEGG